MAFEELKEEVNQLQDNAKLYIESSVSYYKLWGFKVAMKSTTMIIKWILITICGVMVLLFGSIAGSFAIGDWLGSTAMGFLIVSGFYLLLLIIFLFIKPQIIEGSLLRKFSDIFFND